MLPRLFLAASLFVASAAFAAEAAGVLTKAPAVIQPAEPEYPADARAQGLAADVTLEIDISETGEILDANVTGPAGHGFDEAARAAAFKLRFSPAEIDGKPSAVRIEFRFHFEMKAAPAPSPDPNNAPNGSVAEVAQPVNLRGRVLERGTKIPVPGAMVEIGDGVRSASSDGEGRFEVHGVPVGKVKVVIVAQGYLRFETTETIEEGKAVEASYYLRKAATDAFETVVVGQKEKKEVSTVALSVGEIAKIPGVSGDAVKVVQNLPGAARSPFGMGMLILRGGSPRDSRVYVDGMEVPAVFHFGGLTSVYPSELLDNVEYEPGNFGAQYGRATAGRVELHSRDPNSKQLHLVARADFIDALVMAEGPITDNLAVAVSVRRSYFDAVLSAVPMGDTHFTLAPRYYDYQGKVTWKVTPRDTLRLNIFGSDDGMRLVGIDSGMIEDISSLKMAIKFAVLTLGWERRIDDKTRLNLTLGGMWGEVDFSAGRMFEKETVYFLGLRGAVSREVAPWLTLSLGIDSRWAPKIHDDIQMPNIPRPDEVPSPMTSDYVTMNGNSRLFQPGFFVEGTWHPVESVTIVPGFRYDYDSMIKADWVDPRLAARWAVFERTVAKAGIGLYHQAPNYVYVTEEWGNPKLGPEAAVQASGGVEQHLWGPLSVDAQVYYKRLYDLTLPSEKLVQRDGDRMPERYNNGGTGNAYGAEILLRYKPDSRFFGWLAYTWAKTTREPQNAGGRIDATGEEYDQPHNLIAVGSVALPEISEGLTVGFRLRYSSGNPNRAFVGSVYDADGDSWSGIPDSKVTGRLPDFFQADLRIEKQWIFKTWSLTGSLEVQNVTYRQNVEGVTNNHDFTLSSTYSGVPIYPSLGLRLEY